MRENDPGMRLLLVEDDPNDALLLEMNLRGAGVGFSCRRVETEPDFRAGLSDFRPDLILSDYSMPRFDGLSALRIARQAAPEVPFVFFSGTIGEERALEALRGGAADYVLKDRPMRLVSVIRRCLQEAQERAALSRMRRIRDIFGQFVAPEVVEHMLSFPESELARDEQRVVTVLFTDVRSFTAYASHTDPREVVRSLNEVFELEADAVRAEHGILSKFMGDGIMALFGAPVTQAGHARGAARAALRIRASVGRLSAERAKAGLVPLLLGMGINTGEVVAGLVGARERREYTVIGHAVNLASRLEEAAGPDEILLGPEAVAHLGAEFAVRRKTGLRLAGIDGDVEAYELDGLKRAPGA